jgi:hypothetical protein
LEFEGPLTCAYYTVTVGEADRPPTGWELEGSPDGTNWTTLDQRSRPVFRWDRQLRVFLVEQPQAHRFHRIVIHASEAASIAQVELYG